MRPSREAKRYFVPTGTSATDQYIGQPSPIRSSAAVVLYVGGYSL
jgi:hypothetical protein